MWLTQGNDPGWTSFSDYKITTPNPHLSSKWIFSRCSKFDGELTASVRKPWMNYVNNGLKQIFDYWSFYLLWIFKYLIFTFYYWQHPKNCFRWQKWFLKLYICFILRYNQIIKRNNQIIKTNSQIFKITNV